MAKIEELTELLVNEINSFEKNITKLEAVNEKINSTKISIDLKNYNSITHSYLGEMSKNIETQQRLFNKFDGLLKNARVYPKWAILRTF